MLFDRDDTLIRNVPGLTDPREVYPVAGAHSALARLRRSKLRTGVITRQPGMDRALTHARQVSRVHTQVEALLGPFNTWQICPHDADETCECRTPAPGLVLAAAAALDLEPAQCVVVGDHRSDVEAAIAAGARGVLVTTAATRAEDVQLISDRIVVVDDLARAVDRCLSWARS